MSNNIMTICYEPLESFKSSISRLFSHDVQAQVEYWEGFTPFHLVLEQLENQETIEKITYLFTHAKRLRINPNGRVQPKTLPKHAWWNNTALHHCISYENFKLVPVYLQQAKDSGFDIDLDAIDSEGKNPFMLALKIGYAPIEVLSMLITAQNYNKPDNTGATPIMIACATRQIDAVKLILQFEANRRGLGKLDFDNITQEQRIALADFIHPQHPQSGKRLGHYAIMRAGSELDMKRANAYQETVLNILKSVGVDGNRDKYARSNAVVTEKRDPIWLRDNPNTTAICYSGRQNLCGKVLLATPENIQAVLQNEKVPPQTRQYLIAQKAHFAGISHLESIMARTLEMVNFLASLGLDYSLKQKNGKTPASYINGLVIVEDKSLINPLDGNSISFL